MRKETAAIAAFYEARAYAPLWVQDGAPQRTRPRSVISEPRGRQRLRPRRRGLRRPEHSPRADPGTLAGAELTLTRSALLYARPRARQAYHEALRRCLNSNLDRKPQLPRSPRPFSTDLAAASDPGAALLAMHPKHPAVRAAAPGLHRGRRRQGGAGRRRQGRALRLRQAPARQHGAVALDARRHWANSISGTTCRSSCRRVFKDGEVMRTERIVAGELGKQTPIFSRPAEVRRAAAHRGSCPKASR